MTFISYAQNFEDVMLYRALKNVRHGFYVDVGAQHPVKDSVTKAFSLLGWRGINVEPVRHWFELLEQDRPHDTNLNIAVSEQAGFLELFEVADTGLSTGDREFAERHRAEGHQVIAHRVPARTLDEVLAEHAPGEVHFLKVDCEGAERSVLASCSFERVRPWVVVVEATLPNSQVSVHEEWEHLLTDRAYRLAYRDGLNRYYVAQEHAELLGAFDLPPNVFDDFVRKSEQDAHEGLNEAHVRLRKAVVEAAEAQHAVAGLANHLTVLDEHYKQWQADGVSRLAAMEQDNQSLHEALQSAQAAHTQELAKLVDEAAGHRAERDRLLREIDDMRMDVARRLSSFKRRNSDELESLLHRQHDLLRQIETLRSSHAALEQRLHETLHSTSWRLTAPVRSVKLTAAKGVRWVWRTGRPLVARGARAARPLVRSALRVPLFRRCARTIVGPESMLGRRIRTFLFPQPVNPLVAPLELSEQAAAVNAMLKRVIARRKQLG
ncbi:FkbM family methyltransferase [Dyella sp. BiH032]|uniref:FkbM family methyltransferase n=1 Tax=Dyella sp. BiH032 TaxID=3075430 RepID=UPI00289300EE|nr:FkbM family methyltransferase [Dyella sp. BiH032]WNL45550.1 FkbM family methyltransferase [Dyella sp. BiH032]